MRFITIALLCVSVLCACGGGSSSTSSEEDEEDLTTAWETIEALTGSDGVWTLDQAKQAFSLLIAPLPNVTVPTGADSTEAAAAGHNTGELGATPATLSMIARWDELTAQEQAIVGQSIGSLIQSAAPSQSSLPSKARLVGTTAELEAQLLAQIKVQIAALETKLGVAFTVPIILGVITFANDNVLAQTLALTNTEAAMGVNFTPETNPGAPGICYFFIAPQTAAADDASMRSTLTHEAFHCFQAQIQGLKLHRDKTKFAMWVQESSANWAADQVVGLADVATSYWQKWFQKPLITLPKRIYTAHGFFAEVDYLGNSVWPIMVKILNANSSDEALGYLTNPVSAVLKRSWAVSLTRQASRGMEWDISGSGVPSGVGVVPKFPTLADTDVEIFSVDPWAAEVFQVVAPAEIIMMDIVGAVRLGDAAGLDASDYKVPIATLCTVSDCTCPDGSALPFKVTKVSTPFYLAFTGWSTGLEGVIEGYSLKRFCTDHNKEPSKRFCKIVAPIVTTAPAVVAYQKGHPTEFKSAWTDHTAIVKAANEVAPVAISKEWGRIVELYDTYTTPFYAATNWDPIGILVFDENNPQKFIDGKALWEAYSATLKLSLSDLQAGAAYLQSACKITWTP